MAGMFFSVALAQNPLVSEFDLDPRKFRGHLSFQNIDQGRVRILIKFRLKLNFDRSTM
jgi:hypothetical protein